MAERQEADRTQNGLVSGYALCGPQAIAYQVVVCKHDPFGPSGGARSIDIGSNVFFRDLLSVGSKIDGIVLPEFTDFCPVFEAIELVKGINAAFEFFTSKCLSYFVVQVTGGSKDDVYLSMVDDIGIVLDRDSGIEWHADGADLLCGKVDKVPLGAVLRDNGDFAPGFDTGSEQATTQVIADIHDFEGAVVHPLAIYFAVKAVIFWGLLQLIK